MVVLGYRNHDARRANAVNRWRVRAALRSFDTEPGRVSRLIVCGGAAAGASRSEASLMAAYARECGFTGELILDEKSRSTWENVSYASQLIDDAQRIKIVSNSLHAKKARLYLYRQRPDLAARLVRADDYRFGEWWPLKPVLAAYGLFDLRRTKRYLAAHPPSESAIVPDVVAPTAVLKQPTADRPS